MTTGSSIGSNPALVTCYNIFYKKKLYTTYLRICGSAPSSTLVCRSDGHVFPVETSVVLKTDLDSIADPDLNGHQEKCLGCKGGLLGIEPTGLSPL